MSSSHGILLQYVSSNFQQKRMIQEVSQEKLLFSFSKFLTSNVLSVFECLLAGSPVKKHWVPLGMAGWSNLMPSSRGYPPPNMQGKGEGWHPLSWILVIFVVPVTSWGNIPMYDYIYSKQQIQASVETVSKDTENWVSQTGGKGSSSNRSATNFNHDLYGYIIWETIWPIIKYIWYYRWYRRCRFLWCFSASPSLKHISQNQRNKNCQKIAKLKECFFPPTSITYTLVAGIELFFDGFWNSRKYPKQ